MSKNAILVKQENMMKSINSHRGKEKKILNIIEEHKENNNNKENKTINKDMKKTPSSKTIFGSERRFYQSNLLPNPKDKFIKKKFEEIDQIEQKSIENSIKNSNLINENFISKPLNKCTKNGKNQLSGRIEIKDKSSLKKSNETTTILDFSHKKLEFVGSSDRNNDNIDYEYSNRTNNDQNNIYIDNINVSNKINEFKNHKDIVNDNKNDNENI